jgi:arabinofuranan 3-O-arabinosyltransferase
MASLDIATGQSTTTAPLAPAWRPDIIRALAYCWIPGAFFMYAFDLLQQTRQGLTDGAGRSFGDDFINYWSAPFLAWRGRVADIYDWSAFHAFEQGVVGAHLDFYHYSYPPLTLLLTAPLAALPYVPALGVWLVGGWFAFYRALRLAAPRGALTLSLAMPAFLISVIGGQNGPWTAALLGGGLCLLERRPTVAGVLFGLMAYKPHLAILLPVALIAGRKWRTIVAAGLTVGALALASVLIFGLDVWSDYLRNANLLRLSILEDGAGVWHRMMSVFVFARRIGLGVGAAYAAQAASGLLAAAVVAIAWARERPLAERYVLLLLGTCLATPYLQDYDLVFGAFLVAWLVRSEMPDKSPRLTAIVLALIVLSPLAAAPLGKLTGLASGPLFLVPAFAIVALSVLPGKTGLSALFPRVASIRVGADVGQAVDARTARD